MSVLPPPVLSSLLVAPEWLPTYAAVFAAAFAAALIATPIMRRIAIRQDIVDHPDLTRKLHARPIAYLGGLAIFLGWFAGVGMSYLLAPQQIAFEDQLLSVRGFPLMFVIGAAVITFTGLVDDVIPDVQARQKIGGQLFAAAALTSTRVGIDLTETLYGLLGLYPSATVVYFTATFLVAFIVLGGCNAVNLIDGLDGLASGVVAIAMASFLAIAVVAAFQPEGGALMADHPNRMVMALATLGAIAGFLPFNWNPATIFMGDAGSLLLGFLAVSAILLMGDVGNYSLKLVTASLVVFAVPITDTSLAIVRRKLRGQPIFAPDSQHLHHLLRRSGLSVRQSVHRHVRRRNRVRRRRRRDDRAAAALALQPGDRRGHLRGDHAGRLPLRGPLPAAGRRALPPGSLSPPPPTSLRTTPPRMRQNRPPPRSAPPGPPDGPATVG